MKFATRAIHAGQEPDPTTGATIVPIYQTSTYTQEGIEHLKRCHETLSTYRQRVEELTRDAEQVLRPFEGDPDAGKG